MWRNWKEKLIDFFYKEVEVDEYQDETASTANESYGVEKYRHPSIEHTKDNVKVAYHYPKREIASFKFPVIPDEVSTDNVYSETIYTHREQKQRRRTQRSHKNKHMLIRGHERRLSQKELEDIPAFMRRSESVVEKKPIKQDDIKGSFTQENNELEQVKEIPKEIVPHSKPDELDKVFRKRDGKLAKNEPSVSSTESTGPKIKDQNKLYQEKHSPVKEERKEEQIHNQSVQSIEYLNKVTKETDEQEATNLIQHNNKQLNQPSTIQVPDKPVYTEISHEQHHSRQEMKSIPNHLLNDPKEPSDEGDDWLIEQQILLEDTFTHFNIDVTVVNVTQGPAVTRFEIQPALGVKVSKIKNLSDDLKLNLAAKDIRIEAPIPGKNTIGIEVPNLFPQVVSLQEIIETAVFESAESSLTIALGLTIEGEPMITNIDKMPHGLIAGATGSGKSVCINTIILSLLYKAHHDEVKLLLVDPKMVELTPYNGIPHLIAPVITDVKAATKALKWAVDEMEARYEKFVELGVRNIQKYNEKVMGSTTNQQEKMPFIVIVIDELADLMMVSPQEVEDAICRIAQKARACGIHLLLATQRPSVDVITGLIKANIPTRIAFSVSSQVDSRTMIDSNGAEKLLGKGDMLFLENGTGKTVRLQGPFVSDEEIDRVASHVRSIAEPNYLFEEEQLLLHKEAEDEDELIEEVMDFVVSQGHASTSLLQRRFRIGYNRAARLIDHLEYKGIITGQNGSKPREVLLSKSQLEELS